MSKRQKILTVAIFVAFIALTLTIACTKPFAEKEIIYVEKIGYIGDYESYSIAGSTITINFEYGKKYYTNYKCRIFPAKDFNE